MNRRMDGRKDGADCIPFCANMIRKYHPQHFVINGPVCDKFCRVDNVQECWCPVADVGDHNAHLLIVDADHCKPEVSLSFSADAAGSSSDKMELSVISLTQAEVR